jgi:hypothetical protein
MTRRKQVRLRKQMNRAVRESRRRLALMLRREAGIILMRRSRGKRSPALVVLETPCTNVERGTFQQEVCK